LLVLLIIVSSIHVFNRQLIPSQPQASPAAADRQKNAGKILPAAIKHECIPRKMGTENRRTSGYAAQIPFSGETKASTLPV
ncbi:MAG: hypothetical protein LUH04_04490, partial [Clostridium sp.]|nr:hypothetical protein [Clostridium sp.]